jgi:hypothetical protein
MTLIKLIDTEGNCRFLACGSEMTRAQNSVQIIGSPDHQISRLLTVATVPEADAAAGDAQQSE